jgi:hypothetical protein
VQYLAEIEEHLGVTIDTVDTSLEIAVNEFDGKVQYGQKRSTTGQYDYLHQKNTLLHFNLVLNQLFFYLTSCFFFLVRNSVSKLPFLIILESKFWSPLVPNVAFIVVVVAVVGVGTYHF